MRTLAAAAEAAGLGGDELPGCVVHRLGCARLGRRMVAPETLPSSGWNATCCGTGPVRVIVRAAADAALQHDPRGRRRPRRRGAAHPEHAGEALLPRPGRTDRRRGVAPARGRRGLAGTLWPGAKRMVLTPVSGCDRRRRFPRRQLAAAFDATGGKPDIALRWSGVSAGRVENAPHVHEQAVCITAHRFGTPTASRTGSDVQWWARDPEQNGPTC